MHYGIYNCVALCLLGYWAFTYSIQNYHILKLHFLEISNSVKVEVFWEGLKKCRISLIILILVLQVLKPSQNIWTLLFCALLILTPFFAFHFAMYILKFLAFQWRTNLNLNFRPKKLWHFLKNITTSVRNWFRLSLRHAPILRQLYSSGCLTFQPKNFQP